MTHQRALLLVLLAATILAMPVRGAPEDAFAFQPDPETTTLRTGDGLRVCALNVPVEPAQINATTPNGTTTTRAIDDEACAAFNLTSPGLWRFSYVENSSGTPAQQNATLFITSVEPTTVTGFTTIDTRLVEFAIFGIFLLAWWNGWLLTGFVFLSVGLGTQLDAAFLEDWTYRAAYTLGILTIGFEILVWDNPFYRKVRERIGSVFSE